MPVYYCEQEGSNDDPQRIVTTNPHLAAKEYAEENALEEGQVVIVMIGRINKKPRQFKYRVAMREIVDVEAI